MMTNFKITLQQKNIGTVVVLDDFLKHSQGRLVNAVHILDYVKKKYNGHEFARYPYNRNVWEFCYIIEQLINNYYSSDVVKDIEDGVLDVVVLDGGEIEYEIKRRFKPGKYYNDFLIITTLFVYNFNLEFNVEEKQIQKRDFRKEVNND